MSPPRVADGYCSRCVYVVGWAIFRHLRSGFIVKKTAAGICAVGMLWFIEGGRSLRHTDIHPGYRSTCRHVNQPR